MKLLHLSMTGDMAIFEHDGVPYLYQFDRYERTATYRLFEDEIDDTWYDADLEFANLREWTVGTIRI